MVDLRTATNVHGFGRDPDEQPELVLEDLIGPGLVAVDHGDPDHVFRVAVTQVRPVHLLTGSPVVGGLDGVEVRLVDVQLANHVSVVLEGTGPAAEELAREHGAAFEAWAASGGRSGDPPAWPADRLADVRYRLTDDVGTGYRMTSGSAGGDTSPCRSVWHHLPTPPPDARQLPIAFTGGPVVAVSLPDR